MFTFLEKAAICRNRLWFLVGNIISLYLALFHIQASLGTIVCTHIYFTHLIFTATFDDKYACLKVTKQRGFFFFLWCGFGMWDVFYCVTFWNLSFLCDQLGPSLYFYSPQVWITIFPSCCIAAGTKHIF